MVRGDGKLIKVKTVVLGVPTAVARQGTEGRRCEEDGRPECGGGRYNQMSPGFRRRMHTDGGGGASTGAEEPDATDSPTTGAEGWSWGAEVMWWRRIRMKPVDFFYRE